MTWFPKASDYPANRLFSLDLLRGLDMFLLVAIGPVIGATQRVWHWMPPSMARQFNHGWVCFTLWDIIMPLFIFMCGAAIPFALDRRLREGKCAFWKHVLWRVAMLWILGGCVQGNWAAFDPQTFSPFANTLQSIAIGYLATAAMMTVPNRAFQIALPIALAVAYAILLMPGGYGETTNLAFRADQAVFASFLPSTNTYIAKPSHYTWFLTSLMFAAMTMAGYHATRILQGKGEEKGKFLRLLAYGGALLAAGWIASVRIPVIKPIFTFSFTAQAMGWCAIALAILYWLTDILKMRRGTSLLLLFGQHALVAYFVSHFFNDVLWAFSARVCVGITPHLGAAKGVLLTVVNVAAVVAVMLVWRRLKLVRKAV